MNMRKNYQNIVRGAVLFIMLAMLAFPLAGSARAAEVFPGDPDAYIAEDVIIEDDLFVSGRRVQIDGTVLGDVFAAGEDIEINGHIDGNLFAAGQTITINGEVSDNLVAATYSLQMGSAANVSGNVYFAGFNFQADEESQVARNVYAAGYQALLEGDIGRNVLASLSAFQLDGSVGGDVQLELNQANSYNRSQLSDVTVYIPENVIILPEGIIEGDNSSVAGDFEYSINRYDFNPPITNGDDIAGFFVTNWLRSRVGEFFGLLILGLLLFYLLPGPARRAVEEMREQPFSSMARGALLALAFPLFIVVSIALVIFVTIVFGAVTLGNLAGTILSLGGLSIAAFWTIFSLLFWMVSKTIFAYLIGNSIVDRVSPDSMQGSWGLLMALVVGLGLYEVIRAIPLLGHLTAILVILLGVGAIFQVIWKAWQQRRLAKA